eukprot:113512-Prorocentrum_minimum.AAC.1
MGGLGSAGDMDGLGSASRQDQGCGCVGYNWRSHPWDDVQPQHIQTNRLVRLCRYVLHFARLRVFALSCVFGLVTIRHLSIPRQQSTAVKKGLVSDGGFSPARPLPEWCRDVSDP